MEICDLKQNLRSRGNEAAWCSGLHYSLLLSMSAVQILVKDKFFVRIFVIWFVHLVDTHVDISNLRNNEDPISSSVKNMKMLEQSSLLQYSYPG